MLIQREKKKPKHNVYWLFSCLYPKEVWNVHYLVVKASNFKEATSFF